MEDEEYVYELDAEAVVKDLLATLSDHGEDVVEQVPAGVWWFRTRKDRDTVTADIVGAFGALVRGNLRTIEQDSHRRKGTHL